MNGLRAYNWSYLSSNARWMVKVGTRPLLLSAGMPRSGSTLLFNIVREVAIGSWPGLSSGWYGDLGEMPKGEAYLVKVHALTRLLRWRMSYGFYSFRDIRTAALSAWRRFELPITTEEMRVWVEEYKKAKHLCDSVFRYEDLVASPARCAEQIASAMNLHIDGQEIAQKVIALGKSETEGDEYTKETLFYPGHGTGTGENEWRTHLPSSLQREINREFRWWFEECGYPID